MEEKKTYVVTGTVTIGTDEYRDLIEKAIRFEIAAEKERDAWWKEYNRADKAEKEMHETHKKLEALEAFLKSDAEVYGMYMVWMAERGEL